MGVNVQVFFFYNDKLSPDLVLTSSTKHFYQASFRLFFLFLGSVSVPINPVSYFKKQLFFFFLFFQKRKRQTLDSTVCNTCPAPNHRQTHKVSNYLVNIVQHGGAFSS